jgi:tetratricopeptide (TPR) repeat protein
VLLWIVLVPAAARAQDDSTVARDAYAKGMAHYHLEEYDAAVEEWERGFRAKPAPEFLYNIAQAYRLSKRPDKALSFYQKYLRLAPDARNRDEVEKHIASLKAVVDQQGASAQSPAPQSQTQPPVAQPSLQSPTPTSPQSSPSAATGSGADLVARPADRPVYRKPWFWGVMGGVAAVVVAGVVVGVVVGTRPRAAQTLTDASF